MQTLWNETIYGNPLARWVAALGIVIATVLLVRIGVSVVSSQLSRLTAKTKTNVDDILGKVVGSTRWYLVAIAAARAAISALELPARVVTVVHVVSSVALTIQVGIWLQRAATELINRRRREGEEEDPSRATTHAAILFLAKIVVWGLVAVAVLGNLGIEISALVAGLGIGGVAAALAVQNVLGDLIASLSIYLDRPFDVGDFIAVGDHMGTVEVVRWRTTRVRALSGEEIIFPNSDLARSRVRNYRRMDERRIAFEVRAEYDAAAEQVREAPSLMEEAIEAVAGVRFDRAHLKALGDDALRFEAVYFVLSPDYAVFMDKQQEVLLGIYDRFEAAGIPFAMPTRTLNVRQDGAWEAEVPASSGRRRRGATP